jgi:hypothetical protein
MNHGAAHMKYIKYGIAVCAGLAIAACSLLDSLSAPGFPSHPSLGEPIDRMGRALTGNALLNTIAADEVSDKMKEDYNRANPAQWDTFVPEITRNLGLYDSFDGVEGNQWLAAGSRTAQRYTTLARVLADDRLWIDTRYTTCREYLAIERSAYGKAIADCGGRTPNYNVNGMFRSLLIRGTSDVVDDGVDHDDHVHSTSDFPFLSAP